ncbi:MAG: hypothetical protein IT379_12975 [Deltaproteobacteria bacterium]|nr:hypothetical protein [Deltaproteobacteria bacterium]
MGRSRAVGPDGRAREAQLLEMAHDDLRRLRFRHVAEDGTETGPITWTTRRSDLVLCASPAGAAPSCTDRIPVDYERTETVFENIRRVTRCSARIAFSRDAIVVTRASGVVPRASRSSLGRYRWTQRGAWTR